MKGKQKPERWRYDWAVPVIGMFWAAFYVIVTTVDHLAAATAILFLPRFLISSSGLVISLILAKGRCIVTPHANASRISLLVFFAILGSAVQVCANYTVFHFFAPEMRSAISATVFLSDAVHWFWIYAAELGFIFALDHSRQAADRERRIAELDRTAHQAQLRALRYQLNPHFLFNTLNSIAALIGRGDAAIAEEMVEDLSDFLRTTLTIDPSADVTLAQEMELQARYLAIETRRFPDRLRVETYFGPDVLDAMVPGLITQPLTENVIKHAVAASDSPIVLTVASHRLGNDLEIVISNTQGQSGPARHSTGVGIANVADRLKARYQDNQAFTATPGPLGGFVARIRLPYSLAS